MLVNWMREWSNKKLKKCKPTLCEFCKEVMLLFSFLCTTEVYKIKLHLLHLLVSEMRRIATISNLGAFFHENLNVYIRNEYQESCRR